MEAFFLHGKASLANLWLGLCMSCQAPTTCEVAQPLLGKFSTVVVSTFTLGQQLQEKDETALGLVHCFRAAHVTSLSMWAD